MSSSNVIDNYFLFWDVESTSKIPTEDDIISIGGVLSKYDMKTSKFQKIDEFHTLVFTHKQIDEGAFSVHHISQSDIKDAPPLKTAVEMLKDWIQSWIQNSSNYCRLYMVAHNGASFDDVMLFCNCVQNKVCYDEFLYDIKCEGFLDSFKMMKKVFKERCDSEKPKDTKTGRLNFRLGDCYQFYCGGTVLENAHDALADSQALFDVFNSDMVSNVITLNVLFEFIRPIEKAVKSIKQSAGQIFQEKAEFTRKERFGLIDNGEISIPNEPIVADSRFYHQSGVDKRLCLNCMSFVQLDEHKFCFSPMAKSFNHSNDFRLEF